MSIGPVDIQEVSLFSQNTKCYIRLLVIPLVLSDIAMHIWIVF